MLIRKLSSNTCITDGIKFYRSKNDVILSPGENSDGYLDKKYFLKALDASTMKEIL